VIFKRVSYSVNKLYPWVKNGQCRFCKSPLENKRSTWCGGAYKPGKCWEKAQLEGNWKHIRKVAYDASGGKCALCGFELAVMMKALSDYNHNARQQSRTVAGFVDCYTAKETKPSLSPKSSMG